MISPNVIIAGAQKSGTSSLYHYLSVHPEIEISNPKEPSYFSKKDNLVNDTFYDPIFNDASKKILLEGTTGYMYEEYVPKRIFNMLGDDVKLIFILKDPTKRASSAYWHTYKRMDESRKFSDVFGVIKGDKDAVFEREEQNIQDAFRRGKIDVTRYKDRYDDIFWNFRYIKNSYYSHFIDSYLNFFKREQVLVLLLEELINDADAFTDKLFRFLQVDKVDVNQNQVFNRTSIPRRNYFLDYLHGYVKDKRLNSFKKKYPSMFNLYKNIFWREPGPISRNLEINIRSFYKTDYGKISEYVCYDVNKYWK